MNSDRIKWNARYESEESFLGERPSPFLSREIDRIRALVPGSKALDIACGEGRNSVFLARHGFSVTGLDISDKGIEKGVKRAKAVGVKVKFKRIDLDDYTIQERFDLIINFNFLQRELIPSEVAALNPGGVLLFDTIMASEQLLLSHKASYLLQPGELSRLFGGFQGEILFSEESMSGEMPTARVLFRKEAGFIAK